MQYDKHKKMQLTVKEMIMQEDTQYENTEENTVAFIPPASLEQEIQQEIEEKKTSKQVLLSNIFQKRIWTNGVCSIWILS